MYYCHTRKRIVIDYVHPDGNYPRPPYATYTHLPDCCNLDTPYVHLELELINGTAAGGAWLNFEIVESNRPSLVGKTICCSADQEANGYYTCNYSATITWDDGFIANTESTALGYRSYDPPDGTGTPMGGEIIDDLDGMRFFCPDAALPQSDPSNWAVGDVIILYGRSNYDEPTPFAFMSYIRHVRTIRHEVVLTVFSPDRDAEINYYPRNQQLGDGHAQWNTMIVHHDPCGPDIIIVDGKLIKGDPRTPPTITWMVDNKFYADPTVQQLNDFEELLK